MSGLRDLRIRRKSVAATHKLTSAMRMVSRVKFNRIQGHWKQSSEPLQALQNIASRLLACSPKRMPFMMRKHPSSWPILLVIFSTDRGFCGGFNQKIFKTASQFVEQTQKNGQSVWPVCLGQKAINFVQKRLNLPIHHAVTHLDTITYGGLLPTIDMILSSYRERKISQCVLLYSEFRSPMVQEPRLLPFLPLHLLPHKEGALLEGGLISIEPKTQFFLEKTLILLSRSLFYNLCMEHLSSENSARLMAMETATENAEEMLRNLQIEYNRLRQSLITKELIEIISGANAL